MYCECEYADGQIPLLFIINPAAHSGTGIRVWKEAEKVLKERGIPYEAHFSEKKGEVKALAHHLTALSEQEERFLIVAGGDGTLNEALQGIQDFEQIRLGYLPAGSSNDLARDLQISGTAKQQLVWLLDHGKERRVDLGCLHWMEGETLQKRYFAVSCGIGYDAAVCQEALDSPIKDRLNRIGLGKLSYLGIGLKQMLTLRFQKASVRLDGIEVVHASRLLFAASMIRRFEGGGFCFCPQADDQDGLLDLCLADGVPRWIFPFIFPFAMKGMHYRIKGVTPYRAERIEIHMSSPAWVQTDGEIPGKLSRITVTAEKQKLRLVC